MLQRQNKNRVTALRYPNDHYHTRPEQVPHGNFRENVFVSSDGLTLSSAAGNLVPQFAQRVECPFCIKEGLCLSDLPPSWSET